MWEIEGTDEFANWYISLEAVDIEAVTAAVDALAIDGPNLGRPLVDTLVGSRYPNLKELRPRRGNIRILFAFDPRRTAILLLGGDKTGRWHEWYQTNIPRAEALYDAYVRSLKEEGLI